MPLPSHPIAEIFPLLDGDALSALAEDILQHGLREPVVLLDGQVLDGRNRVAACEKAAVPVRTREFDGSDPVAFVLSANLHRRHLDASQRAIVGAKAANLKDGQRADRMSRSGISPTYQPVTQPQAAALVGVHERTVRDARVVLTKGTPEEIKQVELGQVGVTPQAKKIRARALRASVPKQETRPPRKTPSTGAKISLPPGKTAENIAREILQLKESGLSIEQAAKRLHIANNTASMMADLVMIADRSDLSTAEASIASAALRDMNESARVSAPYQTIVPIAKRLWGSAKPRMDRDRAEAARIDQFKRRINQVHVAGMVGEHAEVPHLSDEEAREAVKTINWAIAHLKRLSERIMECCK